MIKSRNDYKKYLNEDIKMFGLCKWKCIYKYKYPTLYFLRQLRCLEFVLNCNTSRIGQIKLLILKIKFKHISLKLGFSIPPNTFGPGLFIPHYGTIVINGGARIGSNCKLCTDVCIGNSKGGVPQIGDHVYIAPGVKIFGNIKIGNNVDIGSNAVVNKNFPSNVVIGGVPAEILVEKE